MSVLTPRETELLYLVATGTTNREIGAQMYISQRTVKVHMTNIMEKLNVVSRTGAVVKAIQLGVIDLALVIVQRKDVNERFWLPNGGV